MKLALILVYGEDLDEVQVFLPAQEVAALDLGDMVKSMVGSRSE